MLVCFYTSEWQVVNPELEGGITSWANSDLIHFDHFLGEETRPVETHCGFLLQLIS